MCLPNDTVSALSQLLCDIVLLVDNEVLVEDLEDLATLQISHGDGEGGKGSEMEEV